MYEIREFLEGERSPFAEWFNDLDARAAARVNTYVRRMQHGNFGDSKSVGSGVRELRMDFGPGYRVYYGREGDVLVILLGGGTKKRQSRDIAEAIRRWEVYKKLRREERKQTAGAATGRRKRRT